MRSRRDVLRSVGAAGLTPLVELADGEPVRLPGTADREAVPTPPAFAGWQAGDLHAHTTYSHDVCGDPFCGESRPTEESYTYGHTVAEQIDNAERRGLDYLAITDHNTVAAQSDPGFASDSVTLLGSYEHSLSGGHGGIHGVDRTYTDRPTETADQLAALVEEVRARGGFGVANHPTTEISSTWAYDGAAGMDAVEVWSIAWYVEQTPISSHNPAALRWYDALLSAGHRLAAVGGSDNHWKSTHAVQGVGSPTTWVYAPDGDAASIREGVRQGRTFVSWDWRGPLVTVAASRDGDDYDLAVGDAAPAGDRDRVAVRTTVGRAPGTRVRLVVDGSVAAETAVPTHDYEWETTVPVDPAPDGQSWIRAEVLLEEENLMLALTSPVYFGGRNYHGPTGSPSAPEATLPYPTEEPDWLAGGAASRFPESPAGAPGGSATGSHAHDGGCECHPETYRRKLAEAASLLDVAGGSGWE